MSRCTCVRQSTVPLLQAGTSELAYICADDVDLQRHLQIDVNGDERSNKCMPRSHSTDAVTDAQLASPMHLLGLEYFRQFASDDPDSCYKGFKLSSFSNGLGITCKTLVHFKSTSIKLIPSGI